MNPDALSDLVLLLVALPIAIRQMRARPALAIGALLIALAAGWGVLRFNAVEMALGPHRFFSLLAACAGYPLLALAVRWPDDPIAQRITAAGRFVLIAGGIGVVLTLAHVELWRQLLPVLSVLAITLTAIKRRAPLLIIGALTLIASMTVAVMGAAGPLTIGPMSHIQWLHYLMALGLICLSLAPAEIPAEGPLRSETTSQEKPA